MIGVCGGIVTGGLLGFGGGRVKFSVHLFIRNIPGGCFLKDSVKKVTKETFF